MQQHAVLTYFLSEWLLRNFPIYGKSCKNKSKNGDYDFETKWIHQLLLAFPVMVMSMSGTRRVSIKWPQKWRSNFETKWIHRTKLHQLPLLTKKDYFFSCNTRLVQCNATINQPSVFNSEPVRFMYELQSPSFYFYFDGHQLCLSLCIRTSHCVLIWWTSHSVFGPLILCSNLMDLSFCVGLLVLCSNSMDNNTWGHLILTPLVPDIDITLPSLEKQARAGGFTSFQNSIAISEVI